MSVETADALRRARARIEKPENFCQGVFARNRDGESVDPRSPQACQWCSYGTMLLDSLFDSMSAALSKRATRNVSRVNDVEGHVAVLVMFDHAIAAEESSS